ncbi:MAG: IS1182 family transposase [Saprospiraceae bacterium]
MQTKRKVVFKPYDQEQKINIPVNVSEMVPVGHLARIISEVVDQIPMESLTAYYAGGGASSYQPKMMIKVWLYGYCERVYTSRRLAKALRENIVFIWLSGNQHPSFKTLSEFRGERMQNLIDIVFKQVLMLLIEEGYIELKDLYMDGSKWEANANRHKITWAKNTARYKIAVLERIEGLLREAQALQAAEDKQYGNRDLPEVGEAKTVGIVLNSTQASQYLIELNQLIEEKAEEKAKQKALKQIEKKLIEEQQKLKKYEQQERLLNGRNSYSHTDTDATALRMKDERLLPGYNVQHTTDKQYIVNWTIEQCASDSPTLPAHLDKMEERRQGLPLPGEQNLGADAGYGSEENYAELEKRGINAYLKYPLFDQEQNGELLKKTFRRENFPYDTKGDHFTCPQGRRLNFLEERSVTTTNGYPKNIRLYRCENCDNCPFAPDCKKSEDKARTVSYSPQGEAYKQKAKAMLNSDKGLQMRSERGIEVESSFGDIKYNMQHSRFILREKKKVYVEYGLLSIGHNLRKVYCEKSGCWTAYYAQRTSKRTKKAS